MPYTIGQTIAKSCNNILETTKTVRKWKYTARSGVLKERSQENASDVSTLTINIPFMNSFYLHDASVNTPLYRNQQTSTKNPQTFYLAVFVDSLSALSYTEETGLWYRVTVYSCQI